MRYYIYRYGSSKLTWESGQGSEVGYVFDTKLFYAVIGEVISRFDVIELGVERLSNLAYHISVLVCFVHGLGFRLLAASVGLLDYRILGKIYS